MRNGEYWAVESRYGGNAWSVLGRRAGGRTTGKNKLRAARMLMVALTTAALLALVQPAHSSAAAPEVSFEPAGESTAEQWRGWSVVPGEGRGEDPRVVEYRGSMYLFARGPSFDPRVFVNRFDGAAWTGWSGVPGDQQTHHAITAAVHNNRLHLFLADSNDRILANRYDGQRWSGWAEVPGGGVTTGVLAAAVYSGDLHLFATGTDHQVWSTRLHNGSWSGRWSPAPPHLPDGVHDLAAAVHGNELQLITSREVSARFRARELYASRFDGATWTLWSLADMVKTSEFEDNTHMGPGLTAAVFANDLYVFKHRALTRSVDYSPTHIVFARSDGTTWRGWTSIAEPGGLVHVGGATEYRGRLHIFVGAGPASGDGRYILTNSFG